MDILLAKRTFCRHLYFQKKNSAVINTSNTVFFPSNINFDLLEIYSKGHFYFHIYSLPKLHLYFFFLSSYEQVILQRLQLVVIIKKIKLDYTYNKVQRPYLCSKCYSELIINVRRTSRLITVPKMIEDLGFLSRTITYLLVITNDQISPIYIYMQG